MSDIRYPAICGRCAENPALVWREFKHSKTNYKRSMMAGGTVRQTEYSYYVPICEKCSSQLKFYNQIGIFIAVIFMVILGVLGLLSQRDGSTRDMLTFAVFGALAGAVLGGGLFILIAEVLGNAKFSSYNGNIFKFKNRVYQDQFATLNPKLVNRKTDSSTPTPEIFEYEKGLQQYAKTLVTELRAGKSLAALKRRVSESGLEKKDVEKVKQLLEKYDQK